MVLDIRTSARDSLSNHTLPKKTEVGLDQEEDGAK